MKFDVTVVGGGPAGSAAAMTAARAGLSVCIIDKSRFPRFKLCGGLFTGRSRKLLKDIFLSEIDSKIFLGNQKIAFFSNGKFLASDDGYSTLHFVMRYDFDSFLIEKAINAGACTLLGYNIKKIDIDRSIITMNNNQEIKFKVLIGADGVNSVVAKTLFGTSFDRNTIGFGLEIEAEKSVSNTGNRVEIDFGAARWGYGWSFPKTDSITLGVGGIHSINKDLKARMDNFVRHRGLDPAKQKYRGQFIPFGDFRHMPGSGPLLLCGDAAGLVDPITGEGIAYAMESGKYAAQAAVEAINQDDPDRSIDAYLVKYQHIASQISQANRWRRLIFPEILRAPFSWAFADATTLRRGFLDILDGSRNYEDLYYLFGLQTSRAISKPFRMLFR